MKQKIVNLLVAALVLFAHPASGRDAPLQNHSDIPLAWTKAEVPTLGVIERAIIAGCSVRGWECRPVKVGEIRAVLYVRKHMAETRITFDTQEYSVTYVDSKELRYDAMKNEIHRKYNGWIANLISDINKSVAAIR